MTKRIQPFIVLRLIVRGKVSKTFSLNLMENLSVRKLQKFRVTFNHIEQVFQFGIFVESQSFEYFLTAKKVSECKQNLASLH